VIKSFRHKGLEQFYLSGSLKGIQPSHKDKLERILDALNAAQESKDLDFPGFSLHKLKGQLLGYWSIWVNGNWRITFRFVGQDVELIDYTDYH
jgi:toxin HigB-1